jgi:single-stranded DNA-binding protein
MTGISQLILLGTVAEIEQSTTKTGKPWLKLLLEIKRYRQTTDTSGQDEKTIIPINLFSKIADTAHEYLRVGDAVAITARVSGTEFTDRQTGKVKRGVTLTADTLHLIPQREARLV